MLSLIIDTLFYLSAVSYLFPALLIFLKRRKLLSPLSLCILTNVLGALLSYFFTFEYQNSYPVYHFSILLTSFFLVQFLKPFDQNFSSVYSICSSLIFLSFLLDLYLNGLWNNNFLTTISSNVILTVLALRNLYLLLNKEDNLTLESLESNFYIFISILVVNSASFFFSVLENQIRVSENELFLMTIPMLFVINILFNIILSIGLWKSSKV